MDDERWLCFGRVASTCDEETTAFWCPAVFSKRDWRKSNGFDVLGSVFPLIRCLRQLASKSLDSEVLPQNVPFTS